VVVVAGSVQLSVAETRAAGIAGAFSIASGPAELSRLLVDTETLVRDTTAHIAGFGAHCWGWNRNRADPRSPLSLAGSS
jgi:glycerate 2-kinase